MKVCAVQIGAAVGDRAANKSKVAEQLALAAGHGIDVAVLPELWDLGFYPADALALGDPDGAEAKEFLSGQAKKYGINIVGGSIVCKNEGTIRNRGLVFDRDGALVSLYDKTHLFSPSGEHENFEAGDRLAVYELDGVPVGQIICYDIRFGELVRTLALKGIKVLFAPAAWPHPRLNHWRLLARARAVENQMFVVAVNAVGTVNNLTFCGHSMMVDPWGEIVAEAGGGEQLLMGTLDLSIIADIRERINVFRDRRPELYDVQREK
ncbi:MAG: carbon-nitrogen family hydrolase [Deltaproteobacteria bacterium]|nr:carbon-nitrogen family hydrolase [Deltaproteobacteria bacterium]